MFFLTELVSLPDIEMIKALDSRVTNMLIKIILSCSAFLLLLKLYQKWTCGICKCNVNMSGKTVIVTGANSGIGYETARELAKRGAKTILACRNVELGIVAREKIINSVKNANVVLKQLDLASFASVRAFVKDILETESRVDVLINNAGTGKLDNSLTVDGLPVEAQINHFGPFLLTVLLLPLLKASAPSRIVNVSSVMHKFGKVDLQRFHKQAKNSIEHMRVYSNTKLANVLFTKKLAKILTGTGVTVNCLHPGAVSTNIFRHRGKVTRFLIKLIFKSPWEGAQTSIHLAMSPELNNVSGLYFSDCRENDTSNVSKDMKLADELWKLSEEILFSDRNINELY